MRPRILLALLFSAAPAAAQPFDAVLGLGGGGNDGATAVAADADGNTYVTGTFEGTLEFGGGVTINSAGGRDAFVVKLGPDGTPLWARRAGAPGSDDAGRSVATEVTFDGSPAVVYVAGTFSGVASFDGGARPDTTLTAAGGTDGFLARYTAGGDLAWAHRLGGPLEDAVEGVDVVRGFHLLGPDRDVYVAGHFEGTAEVGGPPLVSAGGRDAFVARFDAAGALVWARRAGGPQHDAAYDVAVTEWGDAYVVGQFEGEAAFDADAVLVSAGSTDAFLAHYDLAGTLGFAERFGSTGVDYARAVALDDVGFIAYVAGAFSGSFVIDTDVLTSAGLTDAFVVAYDAYNRQPIWGRRGGGPGADGALDVQTIPPYLIPTRGAPSETPPLYVTGFVEGTADFSSPDTTVTLAAAGDRDGFLAAYTQGDPDFFPVGGALVSAFAFGGPNRDESTGVIARYQAPSFGFYDLDPVVVGFFRGTASFGDHILTSTGGSDAFHASLESCPALFCLPTAAEPSLEGTAVSFALAAPNPARHATTLTLTLTQPQHVAVEVLDVLGRRVSVLHEGLLAAGAHPLALDVGGLPPGVYVVRATGEGFRTSRHVTVAR